MVCCTSTYRLERQSEMKRKLRTALATSLLLATLPQATLAVQDPTGSINQGQSFRLDVGAAEGGEEIVVQSVEDSLDTNQNEAVDEETVSVSSSSAVEITVQPEDISVSEGETAKVTLKATGEGLTYKWYYKNKGASKFVYTSTFSGDTYTMEMTEARAGRQIYCEVTDKYGNSVQSDTVTLEMEKESGVVITAQPEDVMVRKGETASVVVKADGAVLSSPPSPRM